MSERSILNARAMSTPLLELDDVTVLRRGRPVLAGFSLTVGAHERVAIVGPNGAGKSTLLKLITRECYPVPNDATICRIFGRERWNVRDLRTQLGIVSNDLAAALEPHETVRDIVLSGYFSAVSLERENEVAADMEGAAIEALAATGAMAATIVAVGAVMLACRVSTCAARIFSSSRSACTLLSVARSEPI